MIIVLKKDLADTEKQEILLALRAEGLPCTEMQPRGGALLVAGSRPGLDVGFLQTMSGVSEVIPDKSVFRLTGREQHPEDTIVKVGSVAIGGERIAVIAGPCAVESREQALTVARAVRRFGGVIFRGGAFKPRSSPYSFQGLGEEGLKILAEIRAETGLPIVSEITSPEQAEIMLKYVDMLQVGARNMQNFELLKCVGRLDRPVMLKRGLSATIEEWLMSAEYILSEGNGQVVICERGIRTYEPYTRNTLDLSAIPVVKKLTHLPIIVDPSHATGMREKVAPMARAAVAAGADGLMIEVHHDPARAVSDGQQSLYPEQFGDLMRDIYVIAPVVGKQVDFHYLEKAKAVSVTERGAGARRSVAIAGEPGVPDHKASLQYFGEELEAVETDSYREVFESVSGEDSDYGLIPLEHSLTGSVHENYDMLIEYDLRIVGEITLRIVHCLVSTPATKLAGVRRVHSEPTVFRHCDRFLETHPEWDRVAAQDVARAARRVKERGEPGDAAITTPEAADLFGLQVLEEGVETNPRNYTRFAVIAKNPIADSPKRKSSIVYQVPDRPGALLETLKIFADNKVNLVKLESRPVAGRPWEYMFYVDLEADVEAADFSPVLEQLITHTDYLKILGSY